MWSAEFSNFVSWSLFTEADPCRFPNKPETVTVLREIHPNDFVVRNEMGLHRGRAEVGPLQQFSDRR